jgi:hypothetical protein
MAEEPRLAQQRHHGTSRSYILDRLRREGLTDFVDAIERGRISAFAIACELGWANRRPPSGGSTKPGEAAAVSDAGVTERTKWPATASMMTKSA